MLRKAVLQLLTHHDNPDALVEESSSSQSEASTQGDAIWSSSEALLLVLNNMIVSNPSPISAAACICANQLKSVITDLKSRLILDSDERNMVSVVTDASEQIYRKYAFSKVVFSKHLTKECTLPLEIIWDLHKKELMPLDHFIAANLGHPSVIGKLAQDVVQLFLTQLPHGDVHEIIATDIIYFLLRQGYCENVPVESAGPAKGLKKICCALLDSITKKLFAGGGTTYVIVSRSVMHDETIDIKRFCTRQLIVILSLNPIYKVSQALQLQHKWCYGKISQGIVCFLKQFLIPFGPVEVIGLLENILRQQEVNWQSVLSFTATVLVCYPDAPKLLKALITSLLKHGLENNDLDSVIIGFLLARQGALEGNHVFMTYQDWFYEAFGEANSSLANNKKSFTFLIKFLTDIVPFESALFLKGHLYRAIFAPPKCRSLVTDYSSLAKTRLMDLHESLEDVGIYVTDNDAKGIHRDFKSQTEDDVTKSLSVFASTGRIPPTIMESSIFRKPYFVGRFIPTLLTARPLPNIPDIRMQFIELLNKSGKIPDNMYKNYENECKRKAAELLEGVFVEDDDDDMQDALLTPSEQLETALCAFRNVVTIIDTINGGSNLTVAEHVSIISEKISNVLDTKDKVNPDTHKPMQFDIFKSKKNVSNLAKTIYEHLTIALSSVGRENNLDWLARFLCMLVVHHDLMTALLFKVWMVVNNADSIIIDQEISTAAAILLQITTCCSLRTINICLEGDNVHFISAFSSFLMTQLSSKSGIYLLLKFTSFYFDWTKDRYTTLLLDDIKPSQADKGTAVISVSLLKLFIFLVTRTFQCTRQSIVLTKPLNDPNIEPEITKMALSVYNTDVIRRLSVASKYNLVDWLHFESHVSPNHDTMNMWQKENYFEWIVFKWHPFNFNKIHGCLPSVEEICTSLLDNILDIPSRENCSAVECVRGVDQKSSETRCAQHLLQKCMMYVPISQKLSWFMQYYQGLDRVLGLSEDNMRCHLNLEHFVFVARFLPAHLLLCNQQYELVQVLPDENWQTLVKFVNTCKDYCFSEITFSFSLTMHILQCLSIMTDEHSSSINSFLAQCPSISMCAVITWKNMKIILPNSRNKTTDAFFSRIERLVNIKEISEFQLQEDKWLNAAALSEHVMTQEDNFKAIHQCKDKEYLLFVQEFLLCKIALNFIKGENSEICINVLMTLWNIHPFVFVSPRIVDTCPISRCVSKSVAALASTCFWKAFESASTDLHDLLVREELAPKSLLDNFLTMKAAYEKSSSKTPNTDISPITSLFMSQCHSKLRMVFASASKVQLTHIHKNMDDKCDPALKYLILDRV